MGTHNVSSVFTFANHDGALEGVDVTLNLLSSTNSTYIGGGITIDVRGTTEITMMPTQASHSDIDGYFIGQFIA